MFTWTLKPNKIPKTSLNLMKKCRLADLFCLHMFCNGAQVTLPEIGQP